MKQITIDHFLNYKFLSGLKTNDKGTKLSLVVTRPELEKNKYVHELYEYENKLIKKYSFKEGSSFIYESDEVILLPHVKTKEDKEKQKESYVVYYRYHLVTKKMELAYCFSFPVQIVEVLENNKLLLRANVTKEELALKDLSNEERKVQLKKLKLEKNYEVIEELPYYFNGQGFVNNKATYLMIYDVETKEYEILNNNNFTIDSYKLDDKKENIYFTSKEISPVYSFKSNIYKYNLKTKKQSLLYKNEEYMISDFYFLDEEIVCLATDNKEFGLNQNRVFYKLEDNRLTLLTNFFTSVGNTIGSDVRHGGSRQTIVSNNRLYFVTTVDDHSELYSLDSRGSVEQLFVANGSIDGIAMLNDKVYAIMLNKQKLQELYEINIETKKIKQLTRLNEKVLKGHYIAKPKEIIVKHPNHEVKGFVLLPKDYDKEKTYPAIFNIHGGPKTVYGKVFYHEMQYWANKGYFVMFANPRGSDGKGNEFSDIRGKYGTIDYDDLMSFVDKVLKSYPQIDGNNLFVTGGSYGGFMTNWIVGHTNRFKAAATQRSISNWLSFYSTSDIGFYFARDQVDGHPINDLDKLWEQSPLKYANEVNTPLLFIHSDKDYRCPIEQAMQFYGILKEREVETKLVWFRDETHELSRSGRPQGRIKRLNEITSWFDKRL